MNTHETNEMDLMESIVLSLNKKMRLFEPVLETVEEGIEICDENGNILYANNNFFKLSGIKKEERLHKNIFDVHPEGVLVEILRTKQPKVNIVTATPGRIGEAFTSGYPLFAGGDFLGAVIIIKDLSQTIDISRKYNKQQTYLTEIYRNTAKFVVSDIVCEEPKMKELVQKILELSDILEPVVLQGETGVGKSMFAEAIHLHSSRNDSPFIRFNCSKYTDKEVKYLLFGYEKNAFPEASRTKIGLLELASKGTLYLDHIDRLSLATQTEIVHALTEKVVKRIGSTLPIPIEPRIVASMNTKLEELYENGLISDMMFYYLKANTLEIIPLRERKKDIPNLVDVFIKEYKQEYGKPIKGITKEASSILTEYQWSGNIRELKNIISRIVLNAKEEIISKELVIECLPFDFGDRKHQGLMSLQEAEKKAISRALDYYGHTLKGKKQAAEMLNVSLGTLYNKMREYNI
ncbi:sigma 54-interacting transcriptional regulator [Lysinibacillus endophyticus]|uniref:sigma 54-interacting transcriptional regulator n=1 Tax=Ureibacillus endophyticus TaxID=1978490 RepID=UPI003134CBDF